MCRQNIHIYIWLCARLVNIENRMKMYKVNFIMLYVVTSTNCYLYTFLVQCRSLFELFSKYHKIWNFVQRKALKQTMTFSIQIEQCQRMHIFSEIRKGFCIVFLLTIINGNFAEKQLKRTMRISSNTQFLQIINLIFKWKEKN